MFDLSPADPAGPILDCRAGGSGFAAETPGALAVDPAYALGFAEWPGWSAPFWFQRGARHMLVVDAGQVLRHRGELIGRLARRGPRTARP